MSTKLSYWYRPKVLKVPPRTNKRCFCLLSVDMKGAEGLDEEEYQQLPTREIRLHFLTYIIIDHVEFSLWSTPWI